MLPLEIYQPLTATQNKNPCLHTQIKSEFCGKDSYDSVQVGLEGCCKCGNEHTGSIECSKFLDYLKNRLLLRKDSAPWEVMHSVLSLELVYLCISSGVSLFMYLFWS